MTAFYRIDRQRLSLNLNGLIGLGGTLRRVRSIENLRSSESVDDVYSMSRRPLREESAKSSSINFAATQTSHIPTTPLCDRHANENHECSQLCAVELGSGALDERDDVRRYSRLMPGTRPQSQILPVRISHRRKVLKKIWLSLVLITLPMLLIPVILVMLVTKFRVKSERSLFFEVQGAIEMRQKAYILLDIPATWLVFVSSRASQVAGMMAGPIMTLWTWRATRSLMNLSSNAEATSLPTPYQLSLLIGLCLASLDHSWDYFKYRFCRTRKHRTPISPVLARVWLVLSLALCVSGMVLIADTILHYTTSTISLDDVSLSTQLGEAGRGLSTTCLGFDRTANEGYPCSRDLQLSVDDFDAYLRGQNEMFYLRHNISTISEIRLAPAQGSEMGDIALLLPQSATLSPFVDYRASTIGISTQCKPITDQCNFDVWGEFDAYSGFYCTPSFFGVMGKPAVLSDDLTTMNDSDIPVLASKVSPNLQIAFFLDESLEIPYDTKGYNLTTGEPDPDKPALPDDELLNKVWVAVAGRIPYSALKAGSSLIGDPAFFNGPTSMLDIVMRCSYSAFEVDYTWFNGSVHDIALRESPNGTISEIYHGWKTPSSTSGTNPTLNDILSQAGMQLSSAEFSRTWANLFSEEVLALVGGVTSARSNLLQQHRTVLLVVKIWIPSLVFLGLSCLIYPVAGVVLAILAVGTSDDRDICVAVEKLAVDGLSERAFLNREAQTDEGSSTESILSEKSTRVGFGDDFDFKTWHLKADLEAQPGRGR